MQTATFIEQPQEIYITFISFLHKKEISRVYTEKKRYFNTLKGQKTLSNNKDRKSVIERKYILTLQHIFSFYHRFPIFVV